MSRIYCPPIYEHGLSQLLGIVRVVNSAELFDLDGKIWIRCPSENDTDISDVAFQLSKDFYENPFLPFIIDMNADMTCFYPLKTHTFLDEKYYLQEETIYTHEFAVWDYTTNFLQRYIPRSS